MSVLDEICARKAEHVAKQKQYMSLASLEQKILHQALPLGFLKALKAVAPAGVIAEVKKGSPSQGTIRENFDPVEIALSYQGAHAACISVLTDTPYFQGSDDDFHAVRAAVNLPLIRKDFMIDPYQIYESRAMGADCVLLIMAALTDTQAQEFNSLAQTLGMDVLVEIHDKAELTRALELKPAMIGVNNRNLKTLKVDVQTSFDLADQIPDSIFKISESGLSDGQTLQKLQDAGYQGFLIGESLMRQADTGAALKTLKNQKS